MRQLIQNEIEGRQAWSVADCIYLIYVTFMRYG